ncbi:DUF1801 domain-containing protein [Ulvibacter litoralis]|uniref:DUF1801 domain-containing protein n=1 Tax=Ulvibacter litoralis TaxID=227084 RepID=UPI000B8860A4|nr:DUF1801 domain-containing protein [Ulvibacter litoralis]GHC61283.1 hypothetical protein GCM10008083_28010 [Ulvibacter litoralis]
MNPAEQYILNQSEPYRSVLLHLQVVIKSVVPTAELLYKYRIPFYYIEGKQPFCYLNVTKGYVDLCFWHGTHLTQHTSALVSEGRKHMKSLRYKSLSEIDETILIAVLTEAYSVKDKKYYK